MRGAFFRRGGRHDHVPAADEPRVGVVARALAFVETDRPGAEPDGVGRPALCGARESKSCMHTSLPLDTTVMSDGTAIEEVYSDDDNLEAVFKYLVNK